jgi:hypothetical protein
MEKPNEEQIRIHAHELWERAGKPDGREDDFWHMAERDLLERAAAGIPVPTILPE